jgi:hypothetical protein
LLDKIYLIAVGYSPVALLGLKIDAQPEGASPMTLTKSHLADAFAKANGFPQNKSADLIETLIDIPHESGML